MVDDVAPEQNPQSALRIDAPAGNKWSRGTDSFLPKPAKETLAMRIGLTLRDQWMLWKIVKRKTGLLRVNAFAAGLAEVQNDTDRPARDRSCVDEAAGAESEPATALLSGSIDLSNFATAI